jgi:hypothetical protein
MGDGQEEVIVGGCWQVPCSMKQEIVNTLVERYCTGAAGPGEGGGLFRAKIPVHCCACVSNAERVRFAAFAENNPIFINELIHHPHEKKSIIKTNPPPPQKIIKIITWAYLLSCVH